MGTHITDVKYDAEGNIVVVTRKAGCGSGTKK